MSVSWKPLGTSYNLGLACSDVPASRGPERPALIHERGGETDVVSFGELARRSTQLARRLAAEGIAPGDRVGVLAPASVDAAIAHVAVMKAGAITVPLVPLLGDDAIVYRVRDAGISLLLVADAERTRAEQVLGDLPVRMLDVALARELDGDDAGAPAAVATQGADPAMIIYSSGTTGKPKGVLHPQTTVLGRAIPMGMIHGPLMPSDVFWQPVEWLWIGGFVDGLLTPLAQGCTVFVYDRRRFDPDQAVAHLKAYRVTKAFIPPTALRMLMDVPAADWSGHALSSVHAGGESLTADAVAWAHETLGIGVDECYGMTEASWVVGNARRFYPRRQGSIGRPFPGQPVVLRDEDGAVPAVGEPGEMLVGASSPTLFLRYWERPEATAERFIDGWYATGDLAYRDEEGYLFYAGRKDDLIMSSGHRLGPAEIEAAIVAHAAVRNVAVVGAPDARRGQVVKAVVERTPAGAAMDSDVLTRELQQLVRVAIGAHAYPRVVEYIAELPRTETGKVRREELIAYRADVDAGADGDATDRPAHA